MATWTEPRYSRTKVDNAGACYVDPHATGAEKDAARAVINNWRSSHSYPLNTIQVNLRRAASQIDTDPTVAQRIKRLPSIRHKLERIPGMHLSRMQDLGGCRAVVSDISKVFDLVGYYHNTSRMKHRLVREDHYIAEPKDSGYRGIHLVYAFFSDKATTYNGLKIEIQLRSQLQHGWATAVETAGTFMGQALKSSLGEKDWLRFFALMSSSLALREGMPMVPGTPESPTALTKELREYSNKLQVIERLRAFGAALQHVEKRYEPKRNQAFLLELDLREQVLRVSAYPNSSTAARVYSLTEREIESDEERDVVLVSADSMTSLRRAYPNYFLDTTQFVTSLEEAIA